MVSVKMTAI